MYFRVVDGEMRVGDTVRLINTAKEHQVDELGVLAPKPVQVGFSWLPKALLPCKLDQPRISSLYGFSRTKIKRA